MYLAHPQKSAELCTLEDQLDVASIVIAREHAKLEVSLLMFKMSCHL